MEDQERLQPVWEPGQRNDLIGRPLVPFFMGDSAAPTGDAREFGSTEDHVLTESDPTETEPKSNEIYEEPGDASATKRASKSTNADASDKFAAPEFLHMSPDPKDIPLPSWIRGRDVKPSTPAAKAHVKKSRRSRSRGRNKKKDSEQGKRSNKKGEPQESKNVAKRSDSDVQKVANATKVVEVTAPTLSRFKPDEPLNKQIDRDELKALCRKLPKAELHARVIGSVRPLTLQNLLAPLVKDGIVSEMDTRAFGLKSRSDVQTALRLLQIATESLPATLQVINECMIDYAAENVQYVEFRVALRPDPCYRTFLSAVLKAMAKPPIVESTKRHLKARLIVSLSRNLGPEVADSIVSLVSEFVQTNMSNAAKLIVGIELGGGPTEGGSVAMFRDVLQRARDSGISVTAHFADVRPKRRAADASEDENLAAVSEAKRRSVEQSNLLLWRPDRVAHAMFMTKESADILARLKIPVEVPLTSEVKTHRIKYEKVVLKKLIAASHPCTICCERRALFGGLSAELLKACIAFALTPKELSELVLGGFRHSFLDDSERRDLMSEAIREISRLL